MTVHDLKLNKKYFDAVLHGLKTFEMRKDDRGFRVGDTIRLIWVGDEEDEKAIAENGIQRPMIVVYVTYILTHEDFEPIPEGYVIMAIRRNSE